MRIKTGEAKEIMVNAEELLDIIFKNRSDEEISDFMDNYIASRNKVSDTDNLSK